MPKAIEILFLHNIISHKTTKTTFESLHKVIFMVDFKVFKSHDKKVI